MSRIRLSDVRRLRRAARVLLKDEALDWFIEEILTTLANDIIDRNPANDDSNRTTADVCVELLAAVNINRMIVKRIRSRLK